MTFSYSLSEIDKASDFIFNKIKSKTIFFKGDLGSGKTTLIKNLCLKIGTKETISSPTFPILNIYNYDKQNIYNFFKQFDNKDIHKQDLISKIFLNFHIEGLTTRLDSGSMHNSIEARVPF